ncbi:shikimate dehydrogenase [Thalassotalea mangrovi]|uniref:Shikimate dehydrogenase (NADP(+)) n=1 Tax=Thalassotalea mangrovi TaxID=2572245 RepID=A0A4U1B7E8_9GAMM|nr:shikimate dehydrogenase [Thalassotalea mangrovi]TKB46441.1 shikimate dehydrogenase [Thalassotalea mangrovi]
MNPRQYCVFGNPISQSRSPWIHQRFASQLDIEIDYQAKLAPEDGFADAFKAFVAAGGEGANVTAPFKEQAWQLCDRLSVTAKDSGAVNTLFLEGDKICGDNTDGFGLVADLHRQQVQLIDAKILLLGAGGAARGVIPALLNETPKSLTIANRTASKAHNLQNYFSDPRIHACGFDELLAGSFDVIINATSAGLARQRPDVNSSIIGTKTICYDMVYQAEPTGFLVWCHDHGAGQCIDGLGMLVGQAAKSFSIWFSAMPDIEPVIEELRRLLIQGK